MAIFKNNRSYYRTLLGLAVPLALQGLITFAVTLADNVMVSALGDASVSGVYVGAQLQTLVQVFSSGIEAALLLLGSQYRGRGDTDRIRTLTAIALKLSLLLASIVTAACLITPQPILSFFTRDEAVLAEGVIYLRSVCFSYLFFCATQLLIAAMRSVEAVRIGMLVSAISLVFNIAANDCLIFGKLGFPAMGVRGAALATVFARAVELVVILFYALRVDRRLQLKPRDVLRRDRALMGDFVTCCLPLLAGNLVWVINLWCNSAILGRYGKAVLSAASITNTMSTLAYVACNSMSGAVGVITGKTVGSGNLKRIRSDAYATQLLFLIVGLITGGAIALSKGSFVGLYKGITPEATQLSLQFMAVLSVTMVGTCYHAAGLTGLVKSGGDVAFIFKMDAIFVFCVVLPSAWIALRLGAAPWIVFACLKCDQILKCFVAVVKINRFDWMKNLTRA